MYSLKRPVETRIVSRIRILQEIKVFEIPRRYLEAFKELGANFQKLGDEFSRHLHLNHVLVVEDTKV